MSNFRQRLAALARRIPAHLAVDREPSVSEARVNEVLAALRRDIADAHVLPQPGQWGYERLMAEAAAARMSPLEYQLHQVRDLIEYVDLADAQARGQR